MLILSLIELKGHLFKFYIILDIGNYNKISFLISASFGLSNLFLAIFADVGVTILVIINGLRLFD